MIMPPNSPTPNEPTNTESHEQMPLRQAQAALGEEQTQEDSIELEVDHPLSTPSEDAEINLDTDEKTDDIEDTSAIFQAVGVITGEVSLNSDGKNTVTIGRSQYPLFYIPQKRKVFDALKKEIETTGNLTQRLIVYPKAIHFPRREQTHQMAFQLVGFDRGRFQETVSGELEDLEFKFSGLWQFIPVCSTPCISVFRNFTRQRLEYIKQAEPAQKVRFMKASHIPLLWKDAPIRPFRFNPKAPKQEQGHPVFVTLKAKFLPGRDVFGFVALLAPPQETAPRFLKASKQDKATVQQESNKNRPRVQRPLKTDNTEQRHPGVQRPLKTDNTERRNPESKPILKKKQPLVEGETDK